MPGTRSASHDVPVPAARRRDEGVGPDGQGRDAGRTPMPWTSEVDGGFTAPGVEPWLPLGGGTSVQEQRDDAGSVLHWCRRLIRERRDREDLREGGQRLLDAPDGVLAWRRGASTAVAANLSPVTVRVEVAGTVVLATEASREGRSMDGELEPWGCIVVADP